MLLGMTDVLVARGGFLDDTALLRLHHAAGLSVRTVETALDGVRSSDVEPPHRPAPACVVFCGVDDNGVPTRTLAALRHLSDAHPGVAFVAVVDTAQERVERRVTDIVSLLEEGADDVVSFCLDPVEFSARISVAVRRARRHADAVDGRGCENRESGALTHDGGLALDACRRDLIGALARVPLTAKETEIMRMLLVSEGVVRRDSLGEQLWTGPWSGTKKAIDMHVANLRRKLREAAGEGWQIVTVRGAGFVLEARPDPQQAGEQRALSSRPRTLSR